MGNQLLVTAIGEDRPGIVARLTEVFAKHSGNLQESRMSILGGEFAVIALVSLPAEKVAGLEKELTAMSDKSLSVTVKTTQPFDASRFEGYAHYEIDLSGADHEGIVHRVSGFLHDRSINIQSMDTNVFNAPMTGSPLFHMKAFVAAPPSIKLLELQEALGKIGNEENVEIIVRTHIEAERKSAVGKR